MIFQNRIDAGRQLGEALGRRLGLPDGEAPLVLAIPRGGVVVGAEVARALKAPLDLWLARKIGAPHNPELAIGSVSVNGEVYLNQPIIDAFGLQREHLEVEIRRRQEELLERMRLLRGHEEPVEVRGKTVILVDDGVATGSTALAALASLKRAGAARRILAVPVAPAETAPDLRAAADEAVILDTPYDFAAVGQFYRDFEQVSDEEVIRLLAAPIRLS